MSEADSIGRWDHLTPTSRRHLMPDPFKWLDAANLQRALRAAERPFAGSVTSLLDQHASFRNPSATDWLHQAGHVDNVGILMEQVMPSTFRFNPSQFGIPALTPAELVDPFQSRLIDQGAFQQWINHQLDALRHLGRGYLPKNLKDIPNVGFFTVADFSAVTGIPLYRIPRRKIAQKLLEAGKTSPARSVLKQNSRKILDDCRDALETSSVADRCEVQYALAALRAARSGHLHAAQALATATLDSELTRQFDQQSRVRITSHKENPNGSFEQLGPAAALTFLPIWRAHRAYRPTDQAPVPRRYNRHATIHGVSDRQFRKSNAIIALMVLTSFICWIDDYDEDSDVSADFLS